MSSESSHPKRIALVSTGGTIEMMPGSRGFDIADRYNPMPIEGGQVPEDISIKHIKYSSIPSPHITPAGMGALCRMLEQLSTSGEFDGIVVTHGTDTLEESAFLADVYIRSSIPVVFTAAMRSRTEMGVDGPRNVLGAILTAASPEIHNLGVTVVLNDEIHAAANVTKTYTSNVSSFMSPGYGPLGFIDQDRVLLHRAPLWRLHLPDGELVMNSTVALVKIAAGFGAREIAFSADNGDSGLVVEALGRGNVPGDVAEAIEYASEKGTIVCITSRCYIGRVLEVYSYTGGGVDLRRRGAIFAGDIKGPKLRLFLMACIGMGMNKKEIADLLKNV